MKNTTWSTLNLIPADTTEWTQMVVFNNLSNMLVYMYMQQQSLVKRRL